MDSSLDRPLVFDSNFGDNAKLHIGDYNVTSENKLQHDHSSPIADDQFLSDLSAIHPTNQWASVKRPRTKTAQDAYQTWSAPARFDDWFFNSSTKYLWIQDDTLSQEGGTLLVSDIIESFEEDNTAGGATLKSRSALTYFYCSCPREGHMQQWTPSHILGALIYMLIQRSERSELLQATRQKYGRRLKASLVDNSSFTVLVEILLCVLRSVTFRSLPRIALIVEAIDQCDADSQHVSITDLLDIMDEYNEQVPNLKWVISSRTTSESSQMLASLEHDCRILKLTYNDVGEGLGLASTLETVLEVGSMMENKYEIAKSNVQVPSDEYRWFQYSKAGASWLDGPKQEHEGNKGAKAIWYDRSTHLASEPSPLALHVAEIVCSHVGLQLETVYYACHSPLPANPDSLDSSIEDREARPARALFCILSHMIHIACCHKDGWAKVVVDFPKTLRRSLENLTKKVTKARAGRHVRPSHPSNTVAPENGAESGNSIQGNIAEVRIARWSSSTPEYHSITKPVGRCEDVDVLDRDVAAIVDLIESVASTLPNDLLLVFDSLEHMKGASWIQALHVLTEKLSSRSRMLLCGRSEAVDKMFAESITTIPCEWRKYVRQQVDEHTEYQECLQSLHFDAIHTRRDSVMDAWPNTNKWLWTNTAFENWVATGGVLWIHGKAGSGKSVLAKTILKDLGQRLPVPDCGQTSPWFICDWFYNARGADIGRLHSSMLRALAYEILRCDEQAYASAKHHYRALDLGTELPVWPLSTLTSLLHDLVASFSTPRAIAVVDAIDESENGSHGSPENRLSIVRTLCEIAGQDRGQLRIIILSRSDPLMASYLIHCHQIEMQQHNHEDIGAIVSSGLDSVREVWASACGFSKPHPGAILDEGLVIDEAPSQQYAARIEKATRAPRKLQTSSVCQLSEPRRLLDEQEEELEEIKKYLVTNASGVVLWVFLVVHELRECIKSTENPFALKDLSETCYRLPSDLNDLYAYMISGLNPTKDPQKTAKTKKFMMWIIGSAPWGALTLRSLWEALALPEETKCHREWSRRSISRARFEIGDNWDRFCQIIQQYCGALTEIKRDPIDESQHNWTVHLLHQTTRTFLENQIRSGQLHINPDLASLFVLDACHLYLGMKPPHAGKAVLETDSRKARLTNKVLRLREESNAILQDRYARARPLYDFAMRVVQSYIPFRQNTIMESIQGGDGIHDLRDCFIIYYILDAFHDSVHMSEAHDIRGFFRQCCLRGGVDMLEVVFELVEKYQNPKLGPRIPIACAYEVIRGAVEALLHLENSSLPESRCIWHPTLQRLVECYRKHSTAVDTTSTGACAQLEREDLDEPIDPALDFLEELQKRSLECPAHPSHEHTPGERVAEIHGEFINVSMRCVYEAICQVINWLERTCNDAPQRDLKLAEHTFDGFHEALEARTDFQRILTRPRAPRRSSIGRAGSPDTAAKQATGYPLILTYLCRYQSPARGPSMLAAVGLGHGLGTLIGGTLSGGQSCPDVPPCSLDALLIKLKSALKLHMEHLPTLQRHRMCKPPLSTGTGRTFGMASRRAGGTSRSQLSIEQPDKPPFLELQPWKSYLHWLYLNKEEPGTLWSSSLCATFYECLTMNLGVSKVQISEYAVRIDDIYWHFYLPLDPLLQFMEDRILSGYLIYVWTMFIELAKRIPHNDPAQERLVELLKELINLPPTEVRTLEGNDAPWTDLPTLDDTLVSAWDNLYDPELQTSDLEGDWVNYFAFLGRLVSAGVTPDWWEIPSITLKEVFAENDPPDYLTVYKTMALVEYINLTGNAFFEWYINSGVFDANAPTPLVSPLEAPLKRDWFNGSRGIDEDASSVD